MLKLSLKLALTFACTWPAAPAIAAEAKPSPLAERVARVMAENRIPGAAIAVVENGKIAAVEVFGERAPGVAMTPDARFNVASLTKPVFAMLTLELIAQGKLGLDTRLADSWVDPDIASDERRLLLSPRLTLSHQSGFPNWRNEKLSFDFTPGARHEYSGEGYEYTRRAIETLTGKSVSELARTLVFEPAGMGASSMGWAEAILGHEVTGFDDDGKPLDMSGLAKRQPNAAANLFTTVEDYARFAQWVITGAGLPASLVAEMAKPQAQHPDSAEDFGLGWRLVRLGGETVLSHDGRERGVRTQVFVLPASREAVVILTNSNHGELLVRPVVEATLSRGPELMRQVAVDIWRYLRSVPAEQRQPMVQGISRSPSFMAKLLYAVDATLVARSEISAAEIERAHRAIDPFIVAMVNGKVQPDAAQALFALLFTTDTPPRLKDDFTAEQARAWIAALER